MKPIYFVATCFTFGLALAQQPAIENPSDDLTRLADWMTGSFGSQAQSATDETYFDIRLHMCRIWPQREDGYWIYVEQAVASTPDAPYRQRIYHVYRGEDGDFLSVVLSPPDPAACIGAWKQEHPLANLSPDDLEPLQGCTVILKATGPDRFEGSTRDKECLNQFRGAAYATSIITITQDRLISWDRGFDADDQHIWGAEAGGYRFDKLENYPLTRGDSAP